jgi:excisionase family DNA binding protein
MQTNTSPLFTAPEAADFLRVSLITIRRMIADGRLPVARIGKLVRIRQSDLETLAGIPAGSIGPMRYTSRGKG